MPKNSTRTAPQNLSPENSVGVIAAWDGLYHAFGARAESFDLTPDGLVITGLTFDNPYDADTIIRDVNLQNRRVPLFPTVYWINGIEPAPFADAKEMTAFMVNHFKGAVEPDTTRSPKYVRDAFSALKARQGIVSKRGPKTKTLSLKNLSSVDASTLKNSGASREDLEHLQSMLAEAIAATAETPVTETVTA